MKGKLKVERPAYGPDATLPERVAFEGEEYRIVDRRKVRPWRWWRRAAAVEVVREDRKHERD